MAVQITDPQERHQAGPKVSLRTITPDDKPFLREVYASTREAELALVPWDDATKQVFIDHQFHAQNVHYDTNHPDADFDLILVDGEAVGRLYVRRSADEIMLLDIAVLAAHRNCGVGRLLVEELMAEAAESNRPLRLHVEMFNAGARRLYDRLGFVPLEDRGVYVLMEWTGEPRKATQGGRRTT